MTPARADGPRQGRARHNQSALGIVRDGFGIGKAEAAGCEMAVRRMRDPDDGLCAVEISWNVEALLEFGRGRA